MSRATRHRLGEKLVDELFGGKVEKNNEGARTQLQVVMNILVKWKAWFAGWQLGTRPSTDPECNAIRDHREVTLLMRVELNALTNLMVAKGVFTEDEWCEALTRECIEYERDLQKSYPGVRATPQGLQFDTAFAAETMRRMNFKP